MESMLETYLPIGVDQFDEERNSSRKETISCLSESTYTYREPTEDWKCMGRMNLSAF